MSEEQKTISSEDFQELVKQERNQRVVQCANEVKTMLDKYECSLIAVVRFTENGPETSWEITSKR